MVKMSRERVERLARELFEAMTRSSSVSLLREREVVRNSIMQTLAEEFRREEEREEVVRRKIAASRRPPARGSAEWQALFRQLMEEEYLREGLEG